METLSPANAARLFKELGSSRAVARALGITRPRSLRLLKLAGIDVTPKTFEEIHPKPDNAQQIYEECGSSRAFAARYGMAQRTASRVLKFWNVRVPPSGREEHTKEDSNQEAKVATPRIWCDTIKKSCALYGMGECHYCKTVHYVYKTGGAR